jgi:hypothetical protein
MAKVTVESLLKAIPHQGDTSITLGMLAERFGCSKTPIAEKMKVLLADGSVEVVLGISKSPHYRRAQQMQATVSVCKDLSTSV